MSIDFDMLADIADGGCETCEYLANALGFECLSFDTCSDCRAACAKVVLGVACDRDERCGRAIPVQMAWLTVRRIREACREVSK